MQPYLGMMRTTVAFHPINSLVRSFIHALPALHVECANGNVLRLPMSQSIQARLGETELIVLCLLHFGI